MKIDSNSPINKANSAKKKSKISSSNDSGFSSLLDSMGESESSPNIANTGLAAPVSAIDGMLALQEVSADEEAKKKAIKQGNLTLDTLEDLRIAMLLGEVTPTKLDRIYNQIQQQKDIVTNPELQAIMHEIEIRAAVELAKFNR